MSIDVRGAYGRAQAHPTAGTCVGATYHLGMRLDRSSYVAYDLTIADPRRRTWQVTVVGYPNIPTTNPSSTTAGVVSATHAIEDLDGGLRHEVRFGPRDAPRSCVAAATARGSVVDELIFPTQR